MSHLKWGVEDYAWVFNRCNTLPSNASIIWLNFCQSWNGLKKDLTFNTPTSALECRYVPMWSPNVLQLNLWAMGCTIRFKGKWEITSLAQLIDVEGETIPWENQLFLQHIPRAKQAYERLVGSIAIEMLEEASDSMPSAVDYVTNNIL